MVEPGTGTLSVCLPTMHPLFSCLKPHSSSAQRTSDTDGEEHKDEGLETQSSVPTTATIPKPSQSASFAHLGVLGGELQQLFGRPSTEESAIGVLESSDQGAAITARPAPDADEVRP